MVRQCGEWRAVARLCVKGEAVGVSYRAQRKHCGQITQINITQKNSKRHDGDRENHGKRRNKLGENI